MTLNWQVPLYGTALAGAVHPPDRRRCVVTQNLPNIWNTIAMAPTIPACSLLVALTLGTSPRCRSEPLPPPSVPELRSELRLATDEIDCVYQ